MMVPPKNTVMQLKQKPQTTVDKLTLLNKNMKLMPWLDERIITTTVLDQHLPPKVSNIAILAKTETKSTLIFDDELI